MYNLHAVKHTHLKNTILMSFNKCIYNWCNHLHKEDKKHSNSQKFPEGFLQLPQPQPQATTDPLSVTIE